MVSQHLVSSYIPNKVLQRNLITLELKSNSGDDFQQKEWSENVFPFEAWPCVRTGNSKPQLDTLSSFYTEVYASRKL